MKKRKRILGVLMLFMMIGMLLACTKEDEGQNSIENVQIKQEKEEDIQEEVKQEESQQEETEEETKEEELDSEEEKEIVLDESKAILMKTTSNVNFRKSPGTDGEKIRTLSRGTEVKQYEVKDGWALIKYKEAVGYVSAKYLADPSKVVEEEKEQESTDKNKVEAIPGQHRNPNSAVVVIDPGHQLKGDSKKEPNGPGSSVMKARVTSGTTGVSTGVAEYILNLEIGLKLKTELQNRGYTVYMTRSTHDVSISNVERAQYATSVGADIAVRIHANGASNSSARGAETIAPSASNPYVSHLASASQSLSKCIVNEYCKTTGFKNRGVVLSDTMTGINWSEVPVTIIELGFMSNAAEDEAMQDENMQNNMVQGIANGIDKYFGF